MEGKISRRNFEVKAKEGKMIKKGLIVGIMLIASVSFSQDWKKHSIVIADFENDEDYEMRGWNSKGASHDLMFSTEHAKGKKSARFDYKFDPDEPGVKYWTHWWNNDKIDPILSSAFKEGVKTLGLGIWIYGDKSGNVFNVRMVDKEGEVWLPLGSVVIDWEGWKYLEVEINENCRHWGGKNGIIDYPLRFSLIEFMYHGGATEGTIYIDNLTLFTDKEIKIKKKVERRQQ